ncbi:MAG: leucine-rich repeat domain-containing protein [Oscillospiraceae bacterium]|nr:leucine-rich repeat domain-containing protein [Oscillospiraceae bacterium]
MKRRLFWTIPFMLLLSLLLLAGTAFADGAILVRGECGRGNTWVYSPEEQLLRITGVSTQDTRVGKVAYSDDWAAFDSEVQTLWIEGDMKTISRETFTSFSALTCVVVDAPSLTEDGIKENAFAGVPVSEVFCVGTQEEKAALAQAIGPAAKATFLENVSGLCRIQIGDCEHGTIVTDAGSYVGAGDEILVSVLPEDGYICESIEGGAEITMHRRTITENTQITAVCREDSRTQSVTGIWGESVKWILYSDGELFFTGVGPISAQDNTVSYPWNGQSAAVTSVVIDGGITSVPAAAFALANAEEAVIGEDVDSVGSNAFSGCAYLAMAEFMGACPTTTGETIFPTNEIGHFLVMYHGHQPGWENGLTDNNGNGLTYPVSDADEIITDFSTLTFDDKNKVYRNAQNIIFTLDKRTHTASVGTDSTTSFNNSQYIGNNQGIVMIPDEVSYSGQSYRVTYVSNNAFSGNRLLRELTLSANVRDVAYGAFYGCTRFTDFHVDEASGSFTAVDGILYDSDMITLYVVPGGKHFISFEVPSSVGTIGVGAFYGCMGIQKVTIRTGVEAISDYAFQYAMGIQTLNIENDVMTIGNYVFNNCSSLKSLYIYDGVESIGKAPFAGCTSLQELTVPFVGYNSSYALKLTDMFGTDAANMPVNLGKVTVTGGSLAAGAFQACTYLTEVNLDRSIKTIPDNCFAGCTNMRYFNLGQQSEDGIVKIGTHIVNIGSYAFSACPHIARFEADEYSGYYSTDFWGVLYDKWYIRLICYPPAAEYQYYCVKGNAQYIYKNAFYGCGNLISVNIPSRGTALEEGAFNTTTCRICVHENSSALRTLGVTSGVWIFEQHDPQSIQIQRIADKLAFEAGTTWTFQNLYFIAVYPGVTILLDEVYDYSLRFSSYNPGPQTVTATYNKTDAYGQPLRVSFNILLVPKEKDKQLLEYKVESSTAEYGQPAARAEFYGFDGELLDTAEAMTLDNVSDPACNDFRFIFYVPSALMDGSARTLKMIPMDGDEPRGTEVTDTWLPAPKELSWKAAHYTDPASGEVRSMERDGQISWMTAGSGLSYRLELFRSRNEWGPWEASLGTFTADTVNGPYYDCIEFLQSAADFGTGTYYFTVTTLSDGGQHTHDSKTIRSDDFVYSKPRAVLGECENLTWEDGGKSLTWDLPSDAEYYGGQTVSYYFRRWKTGDWRYVGDVTSFYEAGSLEGVDAISEKADSAYAMNEHRAGFYAFTVTGETSDLSVMGRSEASEMSAPSYYAGK